MDSLNPSSAESSSPSENTPPFQSSTSSPPLLITFTPYDSPSSSIPGASRQEPQQPMMPASSKFVSRAFDNASKNDASMARLVNSLESYDFQREVIENRKSFVRLERIGDKAFFQVFNPSDPHTSIWFGTTVGPEGQMEQVEKPEPKMLELIEDEVVVEEASREESPVKKKKRKVKKNKKKSRAKSAELELAEVEEVLAPMTEEEEGDSTQESLGLVSPPTSDCSSGDIVESGEGSLSEEDEEAPPITIPSLPAIIVSPCEAPEQEHEAPFTTPSILLDDLIPSEESPSFPSSPSRDSVSPPTQIETDPFTPPTSPKSDSLDDGQAQLVFDPSTATNILISPPESPPSPPELSPETPKAKPPMLSPISEDDVEMTPAELHQLTQPQSSNTEWIDQQPPELEEDHSEPDDSETETDESTPKMSHAALAYIDHPQVILTSPPAYEASPPAPQTPSQQISTETNTSPTGKEDISFFHDYPLYTSFTLFFSSSTSMNSILGKASATKIKGAEEYSHGLIPIFTASTLADFFGCWKALRRRIAVVKSRPIEVTDRPLAPGMEGLGIQFMQEDATFHLFKTGVKPMWEDPRCKNGGKMMISGSPAIMDPAFFQLAVQFAGGILESAVPAPSRNSVVGIVLSKRRTTTRLEIWLGGSATPTIPWIREMEKWFKTEFQGVIFFEYKAFHDSVKTGGQGGYKSSRSQEVPVIG